MSEKSDAITLEKAINSITTAAAEIPAEDHISYSTILDVHLTHALEEFSPEDQGSLLETLEQLLKQHEDLARDIAWDLVSVLLPFLESPRSKTADIAEALIREAAAIGNPREVFIKALEALSQIPWSKPEAEEADESDDEAAHSGDEDAPAVPKHTEADLTSEHATRKFNVLISALATVHPRIATKVPSRFLSTELSTLLGTYTKAVEVVDLNHSTSAAESLLAFVQVIQPRLTKKPNNKLKQGERPPLPPRVSTADILTRAAKPEEEEERSPEDLLQARLIASFLSHVLELYLIRTRKPQAADAGPLDAETRGVEVGWAGEYDSNVVRPKKSKVPGGETVIDQERAARSRQPCVARVVEKISWMCELLGVEVDELLEIVQKLPEHEDEDEDEEEVTSPTSANDIPLSKTGSLFLLAHRLSYSSPTLPPLLIFPTHSSIAHTFMIYAPGQSQPAVIDAILFLGALSLQTSGLGDPPVEPEPFMIYLQIFAVISTNASSAQQRFLAHRHVAGVLRAHQNEAVRLAYVRDTLEHCPFESLKAAVVGILKDEIIHATTPAQTEHLSAPSTPVSIFGTPICLHDIFDVLFLDVDAALGQGEDGEGEEAWGRFKELYTRLAATANFWLFLLLSDGVRERLGVVELGEKVEKRFVGPLRRWCGVFEGREGGGEVGVLRGVLERVEEVRESVRD